MNESLVSCLLAHASARPGDEAIVDERKTVTYGELARQVLGAAARLDTLGVRAGDTVALSFGESREPAADFAGVLYGAGYLGAAVLPLYPDVPQGRRRDLVRIFGARWSVDAEATDLGARALALADLCDKFHTPGAPPPRGDGADRLFYYQFSSGTTGNPKALPFTHRQFFLSARSNIATYGWEPGLRLVPAAPVPSKVGLRYMLRVLFAGATFVNLPFPDTRRLLAEASQGLGANAAGGSPWQLRRLLKSAPSPGADAPALRFLAAIGAMISTEEVQALRESITPHLHVGYGSTECGLIATLRPQDGAGDGYTPAVGMEAEFVDQSRARCPPGAEGELRLRAPWLPSGYAGNRAETEKRFRDGWFYPGDAGHQDAAGRLVLRGRSDGTINFGGVKVLPEEVEAALLGHPDVADAAIAALPDAMAGQVPVALVVARRELTAEALRAFCLARIDGLSVPAGFLFVDRLPRAADGKLDRVQLAEQARAIARIDHPGPS